MAQDHPTLACLAPQGRASRSADVGFAHANGRFLAERHATLVGDGTQGEVAGAMVSGSFHAGTRFRVPVPVGAPQPSYPAPVDLVPLDEGMTAANWIGTQADCIWALPPRIGDLERYFDTWVSAANKPVVCVAAADEFRLLRGIIDEVVRAGRPADAQRILFAGSPAEGWDLLGGFLRAAAARRATAGE